MGGDRRVVRLHRGRGAERPGRPGGGRRGRRGGRPAERIEQGAAADQHDRAAPDQRGQHADEDDDQPAVPPRRPWRDRELAGHRSPRAGRAAAARRGRRGPVRRGRRGRRGPVRRGPPERCRRAAGAAGRARGAGEAGRGAPAAGARGPAGPRPRRAAGSAAAGAAAAPAAAAPAAAAPSLAPSAAAPAAAASSLAGAAAGAGGLATGRRHVGHGGRRAAAAGTGRDRAVWCRGLGGAAGLLQRRGEGQAGLVAGVRGLGQCPGHHPVDGGREVRALLGQRRRWRGHLGPHHRQVLVPAERRGAREHFEGRAGQRVTVGPAVHRAPLHLLGGQVVERAQHLAGQREAGRGVHGLADAEVGQVHMVAGAVLGCPAEQHVGRLDVPVHQPAGVRGVQRRRHLGDDAEGPRRGQRPGPVQQAVHVLAGDVAHGDEQHAAGLAGVEDGDDVRVIHRRGGAGLPDEPLPERLVPGELGGQHLECHPAVEPGVARPVDHGHPAAADLLRQLVVGDLRALEIG